MLNENFVYVAFLITLVGACYYAYETIQGKIKPNRVTFFMWALAPIVAFFASIEKGVGLPALVTLGFGIAPLIIFVSSFLNKKSVWQLTRFDFICGGLSLLGLVFWWITREGNVAIFFSIIADALAALPTIRKTYFHPETENGWLYMLSVLTGGITLLTLTSWNFADFAFPAYIMIASGTIFILAEFKVKKFFSQK